jgi:glycosyltransferase involved in cell wall biosynthesis
MAIRSCLTKQRIVIVVPTFSEQVPSAEHWLATGLASLGCQVKIATSVRSGIREMAWKDPPSQRCVRTQARELTKPDGAKSGNGSSTNYAVYRFQSPALGGEPLYLVGLRKFLKDNADVVLVAEDFRPISYQAAMYSLSLTIPYLVTCERYTPFSGVLPKAINAVLDLTLSKLIWRKAKALTFHTRTSMAYLSAKGAQKSKMFLTPGCTDTKMFAPTRQDSGEADDDARRQVKVLCIARLHPMKGLFTLISAVTLLKKRGTSVHVTIKGRGPLEKVIREAISNRGLIEDIEIDEDIIEVTDLAKYYSRFDIYVQPSYNEPFGLAALEAMSCGLPIIGGRTGGLRDLVVTGQNGFLVEPGSVQDLASCIDSLARNPTLRTRMAVQARLRAETDYDFRKVIPTYANIAGVALDCLNQK